jgi:SHS2 domain-containing protein
LKSAKLVFGLQFHYSWTMLSYKLLNHTADICIEVWGKTKKEALANTVEAMFDLLVDSNNVSEVQIKQLTITGADIDDMLINLLREALYLFHADAWQCKKCEILELNKQKIVARFSGEPYDANNHQLKMEIKAVTYHTLKIERVDKGWRARVIFDV